MKMFEEDHRDAGPDLEIGIDPASPDAGAALTITLSFKDSGGVAQDGLRAVLLDAQEEELVTAPVAVDEADGTSRASLLVTAPDFAGECCWSLCLCAEDVTLARANVTFDVRAHAIRPLVWNVPPAIAADEMFRFNVGLRCTSSCCSATWAFVVEDQTGKELVAGLTGSSPAPGTDALHFAEIALRAPDREGRYAWRVRPADPDLHLPHAPIPAEIHLNVVARPDHVIRVLAVDAASRAPVERARVVAHPFRAFTDAEGRADIAVPTGTYRVFVAGHQYFPFKQEVDMREHGDIEIIAEMHVDRAYNEVDQWA